MMKSILQNTFDMISIALLLGVIAMVFGALATYVDAIFK
jgi:hypothetical protein